MKKSDISIALFFLVIVLVTYRNLPFVFYQQDEWWTIGHLLTEPFGGLISHFSIPGLIAGSGRALSIPFLYFLYSFPLLETKQFAIFAIAFHFLNTTLVFLITYKISKSTFMSFIAAAFFATASIATQAIIWIGASTTTLPSTFFVLLSIYLYTFFLQTETKKYLYTSLCSAIIAYFFKESAVFLFILLPAMYVLFGKKKTTLLTLAKTHILLISYSLLAIFLKLFELFTVFRGQTSTNVTGNSHSIIRLFLHGIFYPFESLSQMFPYPHNIFSLSDYFGKINYPRLWNSPAAPVAIETIGAELISIILSGLLLLLFYAIYKFHKQNRKILIFALLFTSLSFLPYIALEKGNAFLDSRYFYMGVAGGGILIAIFLDSLRPILMKYLKLSTQTAQILPLALFLLFTYGNVVNIQKDVQMQVDIAKERKNFLITMQIFHPRISAKNIFYITGNKDYYIEGNKVPFQQGVGYTLMVLYYKGGSIPKKLLEQNFLWDINAQGYKEVDGKGFGYYSDLQKLRKDIDNNRVKKENVISLFYDGNSKSLKEIISTTFK